MLVRMLAGGMAGQVERCLCGESVGLMQGHAMQGMRQTERRTVKRRQVRSNLHAALCLKLAASRVPLRAWRSPGGCYHRHSTGACTEYLGYVRVPRGGM